MRGELGSNPEISIMNRINPRIRRTAAVGSVVASLGIALANQQIGQTVLDPLRIPKFSEAIPTGSGYPAVQSSDAASVTVTATEFQQQILPASFYSALPASVTYVDQNTGAKVVRINPQKGTYLWGYRVDRNGRTYGPSYPGPTIEAEFEKTSTIKMANALVPFKDLDGTVLPGPLLQKFLTVDQSLNWADPLNSPMKFGGSDPKTGLVWGNTDFYSGPQPTIVHLHGGMVPAAFDGHPDAWFTPNAAIKGPAFVSDTFKYVNRNQPSTLWYHDHTVGETRLNVYAGLAGFYLIRGDVESKVSPPLPSGDQEVPIIIQDRQFDSNGQLYFPDGNPGGAGLNGDPGNPGLHPYMIPESYGDVIVVNGKSWPYMTVQPRRYRFRFLNGCDARFLALSMANEAGQSGPGAVPEIWQIGSDGGLLDKPVALSSFTPFTFNRDDTTQSVFGSRSILSPKMLMAPGERFDVIVDFSGFAGRTLTVRNEGNYPFPGGTSPDPNGDGLVMQFRVKAGLPVKDSSFNPATPNAQLRRGEDQIVKLANGSGSLGTGVKVNNQRRIVLIEQEHPDTGAPVKVLINNTQYNGETPVGSFKWQTGAPVPDTAPIANGTVNVSEMPQIGSTEVWEFVNLTPDAHPMHIHLVQFQLLNHQILNVGAVRPDQNPANPSPSDPYFSSPGYRTEAYEYSWFLAGSQIGTLYGGGTPLPYLTPGAMGGNPDTTPYLVGNPVPPDPNQVGWKDTIVVMPGTISRFVVRWAPQDLSVADVKPGQNLFPFDPGAGMGVKNDGFGLPGGPGYMYHCHILDHEDNDMMRPFVISRTAGH